MSTISLQPIRSLRSEDKPSASGVVVRLVEKTGGRTAIQQVDGLSVLQIGNHANNLDFDLDASNVLSKSGLVNPLRHVELEMRKHVEAGALLVHAKDWAGAARAYHTALDYHDDYID